MSIEHTNAKIYRKLLRTILISVGAVLLNGCITMFLVPVISNTVGTEAYGFVSLAKSFEAYALIITTTLNAFAARHIVIEFHQNNKKQANIYFSSTVYGNLILSTTLFALAMLVVFFLDRVVRISTKLVPDVRLLFFFVFVNFWITTTTVAFQSAGHIKNKLDMAGGFKTFAYLCEAIVLILCFTLFVPHVFYVGIGLAVVSLIMAGGAIWIWKHYASELQVLKKYFSWRAIQRLVLDGVWTAFNSLGGIMNDGLDLLICDLMLTPLQMGQLAVSKTFHAFFSSFYALIGQAFEPLLLKSYAKGDKKKLMEQLKLSMKVSGLISNIIFAGFTTLGVAFYKLWIPKEDIMLIYMLTVIDNLATIPRGPIFPLYYIYVLTTKNRFPTIMTFVCGIFNVLAMYLLLNFTNIGIAGIVWTTVAVSVIINFVSNPLYMAHVLDISWWSFYPEILKNLISCGIMVAVFFGLAHVYMPSSWLGLIGSGIALATIGALIHLLVVLNREDRIAVIKLLLRKNNLV
ncbi:MAG: lipopolysaccharide biosynthesis protein [Eubacteriales bacterium]|nr:lipopolysaccharide biosynthesis protein [Eubacteriales bacterium]